VQFGGGHLVTLSPDACVLWSSSGSTTSVSKLRSIFSKDGNYFVQAKFIADGTALATLLKDGDIL
jgi:hypothetical protein